MKLSDEFLALVNEVLALPTVTPMGAYAAGVLTVAATAAGYAPDRKALEGALACTSFFEAEHHAKAWVQNERRRRRLATASMMKGGRA